MFKKISSKLESMFDHNPPAASNVRAPRTEEFLITESNRSLENLSYVFSQENLNIDGTRSLFSQLSNYFEAGLLYARSDQRQKYILDSAFWYGAKIATHMNTDLNPEKICLPAPALFSVLKTSARPFLARLDVVENTAEDKMTAYLIPLSPAFSLVLITTLAEPWARLRIEALQSTLMKINFSL